ncbi:hypothetical protein [Streptomyces noursei]|uniref:hypothetical protein n=1 Tax=Streptomyces noursei TaxID=1971 RepID=UPI0023B7CA52|nr:hypothetical protein [Streptomyces noursei]
MTAMRTQDAKTSLRGIMKRSFGALSVLLIFALSACSSQNRATTPKEVRNLAGSPRAEEARKKAEKRLRSIVDAYDKKTPLTLALVTLEDVCSGGTAKQLFFPNGDDQYKVRCSLHLTAYYGADPHHLGDVLDGIFTAGDHFATNGSPGGTIPFNHDFYRKRLVSYYQGHGPNPSGSSTTAPSQILGSSQSLSWDAIREPQRKLVQEPAPCPKADTPSVRCRHEPPDRTVADIRKQHGMVFKLELPVTDYFEVSKKGEVLVG